MSDKIKPSEVSEVLQQQLQEVNGSQQFDEVGTVLTVSDGVARIYGLRNAEANELLEFENGTMAIVMNLEEAMVGCVLLGPDCWHQGGTECEAYSPDAAIGEYFRDRG